MMNSVYAKDRREWRAWLQKNHKNLDEVWLIYYKKHSGKSRVPYVDAVEEALCFGWIDGKVKRVDEDCFAQRFTPRRPQSLWTQSNIDRAKRLIADGKMKPAGLKAFESGKRREEQVSEMPQELEAQFRKNSTAWRNYEAFPPYYRRAVTRWVASAKREETRLSRLEKLIELSARNERLKLM